MAVRTVALSLGLLTVLAAAPSRLDGQGLRGLRSAAVPAVGVRAGWDVDEGAVSVGVQFRIPTGPAGAVVPSGDYLLTAEGTQWQVNLDLLMPAGPGGLLYAGTGAALMHRRLERLGIDDPRGEHTKLGLNVVVGIAVPPMLRLPVVPYAEFRITAVSKFDATQSVSLGVNIPLRSRRLPR